jgi:hypothetical protein
MESGIKMSGFHADLFLAEAHRPLLSSAASCYPPHKVPGYYHGWLSSSIQESN